jgi:hypothetical protein
VSLAVNTEVSAVVDFTVNVATPLELVVALAGEIVTPELGEAPSETALFGTATELAARIVTVRVTVVVPSAVTEEELPETVE